MQGELPSSVQEAYDSGIFLGSVKLFKLSERQKADVLCWIRKAHPALSEEESGDLAYRYSRVLKIDRLYQATVY